MKVWPAAFNALAAFPHFILWRLVDGQKKPIHPETGFYHSPLDPDIWMDARTAMEKAEGLKCGVGFVFNPDNPFWFHDIDKCVLPDGNWSPKAIEICTLFTGCAVEVSQSGQGLHIFGSGPVPPHGCKNQAYGLELYTEGRFCALTGTGATGDASFIPSPGIMEQFVSTYFPPSSITPDATWTDGPCEEWNGIEDDDELIKKMLGSQSAASIFGSGVSIASLWDADENVLGNKYPDGGGRAFDHSSADAALCSHLCFWTGKDSERIDRLFRRSGLYRDKWESREDYRYRTIGHAVSYCSKVYGEGMHPVVPVDTAQPTVSTSIPEVVSRTGFQFLSMDQQLEYFKGFVYIVHDHQIFTPSGMFYKPEQFKSTFGGYVFSLDFQNEDTTKNAWEAFTLSQSLTFPRADISCFRPDIDPGAIISEEGRALVNTYVPIYTERKQGDPSPFLGLVNKLWPLASDREIILAYAAACVQYAGVKFHWSPLVQGVEGNGKSFICEVIAHAVGWRYTHKPNAQDIGNNFNAWIRNKLFIWVDEIYVKNKREAMEALKPLISDEKGPITPKGVDQFTGDNRANFWCNTNYKDAMKAAKNNRRWSIFFTPQQSTEDLIRDGMGGDYFPWLFNWARREGGHAIINNFLREYKIPDALNPATKCHRAPQTSSTKEAIGLSLGGLEQEIMEAIEQGRPGFCNGWISSMALDKLIKDRYENKKISMNRRRSILDDLGYILHPGLFEGRAPGVILLDGGKPRLYIKNNHIHLQLQDATQIAAVYLEAQGVAPTIDNGVNTL